MPKPNPVIPLLTRLAVTLVLCTGFMPSLLRANSFLSTDSLSTTRANHTATLLPNGKVLVAGGSNNFETTESAELYDPVTGTWTKTGASFSARTRHTATLLPNGKVLVAGGEGPTPPGGELYDPATGVWTLTTSLSNSRINHTATLLPNGKVLFVGGSKPGVDWLASAELYDPATETWTHTGGLATARHSHTAILLPNGKVLVAGGNNGASTDSAELYDPVTGIWTATGSLVTGRRSHTATLLPNGKVLVAGGFANTSIPDAEIYDPATGSWTATGSLITARASSKATLLPSGKVLVAGGFALTFSQGAFLNEYPKGGELYDPTTGIWTAAGSLDSARYHHTATLLNNGMVLFTGGSSPGNGLGFLASAELYEAGTFPDITLEAPPKTPVSKGSTLACGFIVTGKTKDLQIDLGNIGNADLTIISASLSGPDAGQFSLTSTPPTSFSPGAFAKLTLRYSPTSPGAKNATLSIASDDPDENPFTLELSGISFSNALDTDGDQMNDAAEYMMSALGFDWQINQTAMVEAYYANANLYNQVQYDANYATGRTIGRSDITSSPNTYALYSLSQVRSLNLGVPLLEKDPYTGRFKLTMGLLKANTFAKPFAPFPMNTAGTTTNINAAGKLEVEFTSPENAAFFRVESK
jgi:hypothetical protein